jgi:hypothetical protein
MVKAYPSDTRSQMSKILPSEIVSAIASMFGANRNEIYSSAIDSKYRAEVHALLNLLDEVPGELIDLPTIDYLELSRCRAVLSTGLALWNSGDSRPVKDIGGKDPVERIRRLMMKCHDELPPPEPELPFIDDDDVRLGIEDRLRASWTGFNAREWMGATVFAGAALEAILLWAMKHAPAGKSKKSADQLHLADLIRFAADNKIISTDAERQAGLAKDARNLIHPGRAIRSGEACSKATSLTAIAAVYRVIEELRKSS